jgi:4'-phosphopantetheinyl transferase
MSTDEDFWRTPPEFITLTHGEVHVWRTSLDWPFSKLEQFLALLSPDERERANRFRFARDRTHFIAARGVLRSVLGRYLSREPHLLRFSYNHYGKPELAQENGTLTLHFNLAHSHIMALYAVALDYPVGIDLEYRRADFATADIAERFFSPREVQMLSAIPDAMRTRAFFLCWTRKEAYIKARGMGLSLELDMFDVSLHPEEPAQLLDTREEGQDAARWSLYALAPGAGYEGALAIEGHPQRVMGWGYQ